MTSTMERRLSQYLDFADVSTVLQPGASDRSGSSPTDQMRQAGGVAQATSERIDTMLSFLRRFQHQVRYEDLLVPSQHSLYSTRRKGESFGSGLVVNAIRQQDLTSGQLHALGQFRMHQCLLWGWYDPAYALTWRIKTDPALITTPAETIHVLVGTPEGFVMSYICMEPAHPTFDTMDAQGAVTTDSSVLTVRGEQWRGKDNTPFSRAPLMRLLWPRPMRLSDTARPRFLTEYEMFGSQVFTTLPGLARLRVDQVREISVLLRNQVISGASRSGATAVVEALSAMIHLILANRRRIRAIIGHSDREAYRLLTDLDLPVLYAPHASQIPDSFTGGQFETPKGGLWSRAMDVPGRFWPFVIAADDLVSYSSYAAWLEQLLAGTPKAITQELRMLRRRSPKEHLPKTFLPRDEVVDRTETQRQWSIHVH